jgi:hypothetical protein
MSTADLHVPYRFFRVETRNSLYSDQAESEAELVIVDSNIALVCFDMADLLMQGASLYDSINALDNDWRTMVFEGQEAYCDHFGKRITRLYRKWHDTSEGVLNLYSRVEREYAARGFETDSAKKLRSAVREVKGALTDDTEFFSHSSLVELRDAAIDAFRSGATEAAS